MIIGMDWKPSSVSVTVNTDIGFNIPETAITPDLTLAAKRPEFEMARVILEEIANKHAITVADLKGPSRERHIAWPRQEAMKAVKDRLGWSLPRIARLLGGRDHTTILKGIRAHEERQRYHKERGFYTERARTWLVSTD
jgi:chromosomal replication initiation ATPase DnaA